MSKTLSLSTRAHLFVKDGALFIKLQRANQVEANRPDYYILKRFPESKLRQLHEWSGQILKEIGESK